MIALDTNILARFYVEDASDPEAVRQRPVARKILETEGAIFIPVTVVLELEWVVRAFYGFSAKQFASVVQHLAGLPNVMLEDRAEVLTAADLHSKGLDFADALHLSRSNHCDVVLTFDDRAFARRARRWVATPRVEVPRR